VLHRRQSFFILILIGHVAGGASLVPDDMMELLFVQFA